ncbi:hypothetical protein [Polyangium fumosum]|uniref:Uncharacterized protein n=1 Tax=Polyangium fumosum TaxID=889272 RepID=A0A4U1JE24_9BACT|nr:hypothetical protein [Polyangium fumosum]TKD09222.1 hypothetical protein E8A74_13175 [Polyangium fumosum]
MTLTVEALFAQPDNQRVFRFLELRGPEDVRFFEAGTDGSPFDEGGQLFFHRYGRDCPDASRCSLSLYNLMAHERTARIFALHRGRFTVALRRGDPRHDDDPEEGLRGQTADGQVDLRALGPGWELFHGTDEVEEGAELFRRAYERAGRIGRP